MEMVHRQGPTREPGMLTAQQLSDYASEGYFLIEGMLSEEEVATFRDHARDELRRDAAAGNMMEKKDKEGNITLLKMWYEAGDDMYGLVARDQRLVSIAQDLLQKDIYLYSHKMTVKEPLQGGAWEWHQDYGYWYENKCLAPEMLSIWIALDKSVKENGCLQVLPGSQELGRIDHVRIDGQSSADPEYLAAARDRFPLAYMEMDPGDALVFHCNLLHRSDANTSTTPRWGYIASYNTVANIPFRQVRDYGHSLDLQPVPAGTFMERRTVSSTT